MPSSVAGRLATVDTEQKLRAEPDEAILARVLAGTRVAVQARADRWARVEPEGWVWSRSGRADFTGNPILDLIELRGGDASGV